MLVENREAFGQFVQDQIAFRRRKREFHRQVWEQACIDAGFISPPDDSEEKK
ncbi:hypothetical protein MRY87_10950 [bacterium]|nr:hypothetical protein [bacterium]